MTCLSEHLRGPIVARVLVGMVFQRLCVVALLDLRCTGVLLHGENLVVAAARHGRRGPQVRAVDGRVDLCPRSNLRDRPPSYSNVPGQRQDKTHGISNKRLLICYLMGEARWSPFLPPRCLMLVPRPTRDWASCCAPATLPHLVHRSLALTLVTHQSRALLLQVYVCSPLEMPPARAPFALNRLLD